MGVAYEKYYTEPASENLQVSQLQTLSPILMFHTSSWKLASSAEIAVVIPKT